MPEANVNGIRLHYETYGAGQPLVFLHGMTLDSREWDEQVAAFRDRYQVITYDQRGHGRSESPDTYGVEHDPPDFHTVAALAMARIPDVRQALIPDAGHISNMENPRAFNQVVSAFLQEIDIEEAPTA